MNQKPKRRALWVSTAGSLKPNGFSKEKKERKRIRPRSKAMEQRMRQYRLMVKEFLFQNPRCEVYPRLLSKQCHHSRGRAGSLLLDTRFWKAVSMEGHEWIGKYPKGARRRGLLCERGLWNTPPK